MSARATRPLAAVALGLLVVAAALMAVAGSGALNERDVETVAGLAEERRPVATATALVVTELGNTVASAALALLVGGVLAWRGHRAEGLCVAVVPLLSSVVFTVLKRLLDRARPPEELQVMAVANESLPSGHAAMAAAAWTVLVLVLWPRLAARGRALLTAFAVLWVAAVGLTRIYLGVHWVSDVLAGWALGAGLAFAAVAVLAAVTARRAAQV
ncbi:phosphatase PAP2 family protein [Pseudonocardia sp. NPDC049635]|uniref:phosphatase PAP2 family protein n=1 Tax=Pseudonocardia sp. NPDC049635 TaxID=3155506 RepID=UPI0033C871AE